MTHSASFCWLYRLRLTAKAREASTAESAVYVATLFQTKTDRCWRARWQGHGRLTLGLVWWI